MFFINNQYKKEQKKFIKKYKEQLSKNDFGLDAYKLDEIFKVKMYFPMLEIYDVLNNKGITKLINKIYKLKKSKNYKINIYYRKAIFEKINYIKPQYNSSGCGRLADIEFLDDDIIKKIHIEWAQVNNEEAVLVYGISFKKWINEMKEIKDYTLGNILKIKRFKPMIIYNDSAFQEDKNQMFNIVNEIFCIILQHKIIDMFYSKYGKIYLLPRLNRYVVSKKNKRISEYFKDPFLEKTYIVSENKKDIYLTYRNLNDVIEFNEFNIGNSYSSGTYFLGKFSNFRMDFYYQVFDLIEIKELEKRMSKYLNSFKLNIKISDYKWLIKKERAVGEKRLYDTSDFYDERRNMIGYSNNVFGKKFVEHNNYTDKFRNVYNDNLSYIKSIDSLNYNYKIYVFTFFTLLGTIISIVITIFKK
jgi:hypothetical protein